MRVKDAKAIALEWVLQHAPAIAGFHGAFHTGSTHWLPGDAELSVGSDVDVMIVLTGELPAVKLGKVPFRGVLLDVSYIAASLLRDADAVLSDYHLAGAFRTPGTGALGTSGTGASGTPGIILDPSGELASLQAAVSRDFARSRWVYARCAHARDNVLRYVASFDDGAPFDQQVTSWLFATCVTTHVLLSAGMRNPTVRMRYAAVRELLADYGRLDFYPALLELLGCAGMTREHVERHLPALSHAFDAAAAAIKTRFVWASDISPHARPIAIDGAHALIGAGLHREAVFWIVATYARCQAVLHADAAPAAFERTGEEFRALLADLGIRSPADFKPRLDQIRAFLPHLWEVAESIVEANPAVDL